MGARKPSDEVPTGKIIGNVDASQIFTTSSGLVTAAGKLSSPDGKDVATLVKRGKSQPIYMIATAVLGAVIIIGTIVMIIRRPKNK